MPRVSKAEARALMTGLVEQSLMAAEELRASLEAERQALEDQDADSLLAVLHQKNGHAETLQLLEAERSRSCRDWGFADGPEQMARLIEWCDEKDVITRRWSQLIQAAAHGNELNLTNGAIIHLRQQHFEASLAVIRGATQGTDTYGRNGGKHGGSDRRSLAEA